MATRRYTSTPSLAEIESIEGVVLVDGAPEGSPQAAPNGTVCFVCEAEDGGFATDPKTPSTNYGAPGGLVEVFGGKWKQVLGGLGFTINGTKYQHPCARLAGGELWNGNGYVHFKGLQFRRLLVARVDTSVGSVTLLPLAFVETASAGPWALAAGQTLTVKPNGAGSATTVTMTATAGTVTSSGESFSTLTAGEYVQLAVDGAAAVTVTFQAGDNSQAGVVARVNATMGGPIAAVASGDITYSSPTLGTSSSLQVVAASSGTLAKLGLTAATHAGSGNVANINAVTAAEIAAAVATATSSELVGRFPVSGKLRLASATGGTGTVQVTGGTANATLGFPETIASATSGTTATSIPAGTPCVEASSKAATRVVTMQTLQVPANTTTAVIAKVRPAQDDGSFAGVSANTLDTIETVISPTSEWTVSNPTAIGAALTEAQRDVAYQNAIASTKAASGVKRKINVIVSARQSHPIRSAIGANATAASAVAYGRKAVVAPPLGTSLATMIGSGSPAVTAYRSARSIYCPGCLGQQRQIGFFADPKLEIQLLRSENVLALVHLPNHLLGVIRGCFNCPYHFSTHLDK